MRNRSGILLDRTHRLGAVLLQRPLTLSGGGGGNLQAPTPIALYYEVETAPTPSALYYETGRPEALQLTFVP